MSALVRAALFLFLLPCGPACSGQVPERKVDPSITTVRPLESESSAQTRARVSALFEEARIVEFRFTPFSKIEVRAYRPRVESMRYSYTYHCGGHCPLLAAKLARRLSNALRAEGECAWITAAVVFAPPR